MQGEPVHHGIAGIDIEGFGRTQWTDPARARLRGRLDRLFTDALATAGIEPSQATRIDTGDGLWLLVHGEVPDVRLLYPLATTLASSLATENEQVPPAERMRLRVVVHAGEVLHDPHGQQHTGETLNHAARLLDAEATRTILTINPTVAMVLVVSDSVYDGVVRQGYQGMDPTAWQPIRIHVKETRTRAWAHLPGVAAQPHLPAMLAAPRVGAAIVPIPRELPPPPADFTGRSGELAQLHRLLDVAAGPTGRPVVISAIDGMGGVGKSALAIQAAVQLADRFPDGQLYVNLRGATVGSAPVTPLGALGHMLRSLGLDPTHIPVEVGEATARFRSLAAGQRLLVVLDNAASAQQVRPLLPASPTCSVLITSRQVLATLEGAQPLHLDVLPSDQAVELLGRIAGQGRVAADPQAALDVVRLCGHLPLAIRIAGARLAARAVWPVRMLADRLADTARRLQELEVGEFAVRASFDVSLRSLQDSSDPTDRVAVSAFALLSLPDGSDLGHPAVATLLDRPEPVAEPLLERLIDAQLLETHAPDRYRFHDLLRLYAREFAVRRHPGPQRTAALGRVFNFYAATAWNTLSLLRPGDRRLPAAGSRWTGGGLRFADTRAALGWLEAERANLLAAVAQSVEVDSAALGGAAGQLTRALFGFFDLRSYWRDGIEANQTMLEHGRRTGDRVTQAYAAHDLGSLYVRAGQYAEAIASLEESLTTWRELGDRQGQAYSQGNLGIAYRRVGRYAEAMASLKDGLTICCELGDRWGQAYSLGSLGIVYERVGRYGEAMASLKESLAIRRELGDHPGEAETLRDLGDALQEAARHGEARAAWQASLIICEAQRLPEAGELRARLSRPGSSLHSMDGLRAPQI